MNWWEDPDPVNVVAEQANLLVARGYAPFDALKLATRFWEKVDRGNPDGCWWWRGTVNVHGYGQMYVGRRLWIASRASLMLVTGSDGPEMQACHHCDAPQCVRPDHLYWGTRSQNMLDREVRGRRRNPPKIGPARKPQQRPGWTSRLTEEQVRQIRAEYVPYKVSVRMLAEKYNVSVGTIRAVVSGQTWRHVKEVV